MLLTTVEFVVAEMRTLYILFIFCLTTSSLHFITLYEHINTYLRRTLSVVLPKSLWDTFFKFFFQGYHFYSFLLSGLWQMTGLLLKTLGGCSGRGGDVWRSSRVSIGLRITGYDLKRHLTVISCTTVLHLFPSCWENYLCGCSQLSLNSSKTCCRVHAFQHRG